MKRLKMPVRFSAAPDERGAVVKGAIIQHMPRKILSRLSASHAPHGDPTHHTCYELAERIPHILRTGGPKRRRSSKASSSENASVT